VLEREEDDESFKDARDWAKKESQEAADRAATEYKVSILLSSSSWRNTNVHMLQISGWTKTSVCRAVIVRIYASSVNLLLSFLLGGFHPGPYAAL
jgi:exopolyphosphatase/pppGpp-phosphohydrolase